MSFDRLARHYRRLETIAFGTALQQARTCFLAEAATARRVLVVGEGNGRFLLEFLRKSPNAAVDCVDASAAMLDLTRQRLHRHHPASFDRVKLIHSTIEDWPAPERFYDLIVTHFFLDCFPATQLQTIVEKLARAAAPKAKWLLADFCCPVSPAGRLRAGLWIKGMYLFFRAFAGIEARKLIDPSPFLQLHDFVCTQRTEFKNGMIKTEVWKRLPDHSTSAP